MVVISHVCVWGVMKHKLCLAWKANCANVKKDPETLAICDELRKMFDKIFFFWSKDSMKNVGAKSDQKIFHQILQHLFKSKKGVKKVTAGDLLRLSFGPPFISVSNHGGLLLIED